MTARGAFYAAVRIRAGAARALRRSRGTSGEPRRLALFTAARNVEERARQAWRERRAQCVEP